LLTAASLDNAAID